ncbi:MAG TPA: hypothetical protein VIG30_11460, partial [Ktedonobacterales bacterium]
MHDPDVPLNDSAPHAAELPERVRAVRERVAAAVARAGRAPDDVLILAVSKTVDAEMVRGVYELGIKAFGEN